MRLRKGVDPLQLIRGQSDVHAHPPRRRGGGRDQHRNPAITVARVGHHAIKRGWSGERLPIFHHALDVQGKGFRRHGTGFFQG